MDKQFWSALAAGIEPYVPGEQPKIEGLIKLNTNENPYPPSPRVLQAVQDCANGSLRLYPDPESTALREAIARVNGVEPGQVFVGNGSDEVLALSFLAYFDRGLPVRFADITYSFYEVYASLYELSTEVIPLEEDFSLPVGRFFDSPGGCVIANPNAPTGMALSLAEIEDICRHNSRAVLVDEAYIAFGGESALSLLGRCPNLVVTRTFSKSHSLAGLRVGYAIASADLIQALYSVKNSFNSYPVDRIAQAAAKAAIEDVEYTNNVVRKIVATREEAVSRLGELGFTCLPSSANFLFARHGSADAGELMRGLRERAVLVRYFNRPRISQFLRISIGTDAEMERLYYALADLLK